MSSILVEGGHPLVGDIEVSGAKNSALKIIFAALFSNENIILENVPRIKPITDDLEIIKSIGGNVEWINQNTLSINGASVNSFEVPYEIGSTSRTTLLLAGPLLYRFGKAFIPKFKSVEVPSGPINRFIEVWRKLGIEVDETKRYYKLHATTLTPADIVFKIPTHMGTDSAILSSLFIPGETMLINASEEREIDSLISFCNQMGAQIERTEPKKIKITGTNIFKATTYKTESDKVEPAVFATLAILTGGNIFIKNVDKNAFIPFVNYLTKLDAKFEFVDNGLKVWGDGSILQPADATIAPTPGLVPDWKPLITLLLLAAGGEAKIHDTVYVNRTEYVRELNRMGAKIELVKPSDEGIIPVISDDSYDAEASGEPKTVIKVTGPRRLKSEKLHIADTRFGAVLLLAALTVEGRSEISGSENITDYYENLIEKLQSLGAKIEILE